MWKQEYKRYLKSKSGYGIVLILLIIASCSFYFSYQDRQIFIDQTSNPAPDLNMTALLQLIRNYSCFSFLNDFWFVSDFFIIFATALFLWIGVFLSPIATVNRQNGLGNLLVTRLTYRRYADGLWLAQSLYIATIVGISMLGSLLLACCWGGVHFDYVEIAEYHLGLGGAITVWLLQTILIILECIFINGICLFTDAWVKNKYMIQLLPVVLFVLVPFFLASTIGNIIPGTAEFFTLLLPWASFRSIENIFQEQFSSLSVLEFVAPVLIYAVIQLIIRHLNIKKISESYV